LLSSFAETILGEIRAVVREEFCHALAVQATNGSDSSQTSNSERPPQAVSIREAVRLLSSSTRTVQNHVSLKTIPAIRVGKRVLIPMKSVNMVASQGIREKRD
jgi:excisionase family DNA binding protein